MFEGRRRGALKRALEKSQDPERRALEAELEQRQEMVAQMQLELFETRAEIVRFEREMDAVIGGLRHRIDELRGELVETRRRSERRAQWGERVDSPDLHEDVVAQFERRYRRTEPSDEPPPPPAAPDDIKQKAKALYRDLAKRFHPDLATDPKEKQWRAQRMAEVNAAYTKADIGRLREMQLVPEWEGKGLEKTRTQILQELRVEIRRLDGLIASLRTDIRALTSSETVKLMLDASMARRQGRDLLREMAFDLQAQVDDLESQIAAFGPVW